MLIVRQSFTRESVRGTPIEPPLITLAVERHASGGVHSHLYTIGVIGGTVGGVGQSAQTRFSTTFSTTMECRSARDGDRLLGTLGGRRVTLKCPHRSRNRVNTVSNSIYGFRLRNVSKIVDTIPACKKDIPSLTW